MSIGHLAGAELLHAVLPQTPVWVSLVGVGFPDLLWGETVMAGIARVEMGTSPLQRDVKFVGPFRIEIQVMPSSVATMGTYQVR